MNLIYIEDVVEVIRRCLTDPHASRQVFNVGSGYNISVEEIVSRIISILDIPVMIDRQPMRLGETLKFIPSVELLEKNMGYHALTTFEVGLRKTVEWYQKKVGLFESDS
jgi:nucleoside-diphosphate-sugar epimerase